MGNDCCSNLACSGVAVITHPCAPRSSQQDTVTCLSHQHTGNKSSMMNTTKGGEMRRAHTATFRFRCRERVEGTLTI